MIKKEISKSLFAGKIVKKYLDELFEKKQLSDYLENYMSQDDDVSLINKCIEVLEKKSTNNRVYEALYDIIAERMIKKYLAKLCNDGKLHTFVGEYLCSINDASILEGLISTIIEKADKDDAYKLVYNQLLNKYTNSFLNRLYDDNTLPDYIEKYITKDGNTTLIQKCVDVLVKEAKKNKNYRAVERRLVSCAMFGGISRCDYDSNNGILLVSGWLVPKSGYDRIEIEYNGCTIGEAVLMQIRDSVFVKYPEYADRYSGWVLQNTSFLMENDCSLIVCKAYKGNNLVFSDEKKILFSRIEQVQDIYPEDVNKELVKDLLKNKTLKNVVNSVLANNLRIGKQRYCVNDYHISEHDFFIDANNIKRIVQWNEICDDLAEWLPWNESTFFDRFDNSKSSIVNGDKLVGVELIDIFSDNNVMHFKGADMQFQDAERFWLIIEEILIYEEYYYETNKLSPLIVDCGANVGLAIFYFINKHPNARIIAFEPEPKAFSILEKNVYDNGWDNRVKINRIALDGSRGEKEIIIPDNDPLGASLTSRPLEESLMGYTKQFVSVKPLSDYINEGEVVDYLKLDVEGVEVRVLRSLGEKLAQINNVFCEYHYGNSVLDNDYFELMSILKQSGFKCQHGKSLGYSRITQKRTWRFVPQKCSYSIWGVRENT